MKDFHAFAVAFGMVAVLGGIAYYLERQKRQLDHAVDVFFATGLGDIAYPTAAQLKRQQPVRK